jgi:sugar O-acyltransferase (sialic acid O-acetyltransferase NeuD family)
VSGRRIVLLGAGGHAKVVIDAVRTGMRVGLASDTVVACLDDDTSKHGTEVLGVPIVGPLSSAGRVDADGVFVAIGSAGDARHRARVFDAAMASGLDLATVMHPAAMVSVEAEVAAGSAVLAGAVVQAGAHIGLNAIVNTGAIVEHDTRIGAHTHVSPRAVVLGNADVGEACHIGAGAVVLQGVRIGDGAVVGAGSVVRGDVPPRSVVVGLPGRVVRTLEA